MDRIIQSKLDQELVHPKRQQIKRCPYQIYNPLSKLQVSLGSASKILKMDKMNPYVSSRII